MFSVYLLVRTFKILFIILRWNILWMLIAWRGLFFPSWILLAANSRFLPMVCRISFWVRQFYLLSFSLLCLPPPWLVVFSVVSIQVSGVSSLGASSEAWGHALSTSFTESTVYKALGSGWKLFYRPLSMSNEEERMDRREYFYASTWL